MNFQGLDSPFTSGSSPLSSGDALPHAMLPPLDGGLPSVAEVASTPLEIFQGSIGVFLVAFLVTLLVTPLMRRLAVANGIIDVPNDPRKVHRVPVAYLGGVAVFAGLMSAIAFAYLAPTLSLHLPGDLIDEYPTAYEQRSIPISIVLGMTIIMFTGLIDDMAHLSPRIKIGGQLIAAAALAMNDVGTKVAAGVLQPLGALFGNQALAWEFSVPFAIPMLGTSVIHIDLIYWTGVVIIALFVLGACNATNLIDGLDGLCTGVTAVATAALLVVALLLAAADDGPLDSARVMFCLALLGATLGFLPHNFKPASIFLGDAGSLLLGYSTIVIVLSLGDTGRTHLVIAGLIIYSIPIIDTTLAVVRRRMAGIPLSAPDSEHLHHLLRRSLGTRSTVLALYGIGAVFGALGVWLTFGRVRVVLTIAIVIASFIGVFAVKVTRRQIIEQSAVAGGAASLARRKRQPARAAVPAPGDSTTSGPVDPETL